ncbi:MAG: hypothetical protein KC442_18360 [Thermomicrobiales bacterium]|nr:hypothetical protein [Thermomicrobiales bacterium]
MASGSVNATAASYLYLHHRVHALHRALVVQERWERELQGRTNATVLECWCDCSGNGHHVRVNEAFRAGHRRIIRTLVADLLAWGPAGRDAVALLAPGHLHDAP